MIKIDRIDIYWNYLATFLKLGAGALLLPLILKMLTVEEVGIWTVFITITSLSVLIDFGFSASFARNITYIFSGVKQLKKTGVEIFEESPGEIDYSLLKTVIEAMKWLYGRMTIIVLAILLTLGTFYIYSILGGYKGDHTEVYIAWTILCLINSYNIYTLYFRALLEGKGLIKKSKQILVLAQFVYLLLAAFLILLGFGLIAIVSAQAISVIVNRILSYYAFFTPELKNFLTIAKISSKQEVIKAIYPNAVKIGVTALGGFMVQRSAVVIGSLYLALDQIGSYGITFQLIDVVSAFATIYAATYRPKIAQYRILNKIIKIKEIYLRAEIILFLTFIVGCTGIIVFGDLTMNFIGSNVSLLSPMLILLASIITLLEANHGIAGGILLSKNEVPFFRAAILSGLATILLLFILLEFTKLGVAAMIIAPGFAQLAYQNWKWPMVVYNELEIKKKDLVKALVIFVNDILNIKLNLLKNRKDNY